MFGSLPRRDQGQWGEGYLRELMLDGRRKSVQPMAERLPNGNMQALRQFVNESPWDWLPVRRRVAEQLCEVIRSEEWAADHHRRRRAGIPDEVGHASKTCVALGLLDRLAAQDLAVPAIVADAGYGRSVSLQLAPGGTRLLLCRGRRPEEDRAVCRRRAVSTLIWRPGNADAASLSPGAPTAATLG
ncbi:transposase [Streptomyces olivaceoviridis]|uniref:transposase n=1 Tax=Streptomyces olivaceoviridis TaxID=1921 RepID=UPI0033B30521